ncbi:hypothetical protein V8E54_003305 [Elaphomyces granulatus]
MPHDPPWWKTSPQQINNRQHHDLSISVNVLTTLHVFSFLRPATTAICNPEKSHLGNSPGVSAGMQQETDNQEDAMQLDTEDRFPSDDESMLDDDQSMCNDPSDNETSGDDRRVSDDDSDIMESTDEETGSDTFANDITGLLSDDSDDDTSSERREFALI